MSHGKSLPNSNFKFIGPAQEVFSSLQEQSVYFLDSFWSNWRNYDQPESYIIPSVFKYKNAPVSDDAFEIHQVKQEEKNCINAKQSEIITERLADDAEILAYNALRQLSHDKIQSPFIVVRGLDLRLNYDSNKKLHGTLTKIFPNLDWGEFENIMRAVFSKDTPNAEYDFILIGPKIGIVFIEVKSSKYKQVQHFKNGITSMPNDYKHGLAQLESSKALIFLLGECTGVPVPKGCHVHQILFTPNLERNRYDAWRKTLSEDGANYVKTKVGQTEQWFKEDELNCEEQFEKPPLYTMLRNALQELTPISMDIYEAYVPIIAAMVSVTMTSSNNATQIDLNQLNFSEFDGVMKENSRILNQNPLEGQKSFKLAPASVLTRALKTKWAQTVVEGRKEIPAKMIFHSPDQQKAINGPRRQLIIGAAGTGKTIILQAKALELLQEDQSVTIIVPRSYAWQYKMLFDNCGFTKYRIFYWSSGMTRANRMGKILEGRPFRTWNIPHIFTNVFKYEFSDPCKRLAREMELMKNSHHLLIDDGFDDKDFHTHDRYYLSPIIMMKSACCNYPEKTLWMGMDPYTVCIGYSHRRFTWFNRMVMNFLLDGWKNTPLLWKVLVWYWSSAVDDQYCVTVLKHIMRCSEAIFRVAYSNQDQIWRPELLPCVGHKIQGAQVVTITDNYPTFDEALVALQERIDAEVHRIRIEGIELGNVAVVVGGHSELDSPLYCFLAKKCQPYWSDLENEAPTEMGFIQLTSETDFPIIGSGLSLHNWYEVSSLEWPIIIFVTCIPTKVESSLIEDIKYQRYRAISRGTTKLIDICLTYGAVQNYQQIERAREFGALQWNVFYSAFLFCNMLHFILDHNFIMVLPTFLLFKRHWKDVVGKEIKTWKEVARLMLCSLLPAFLWAWSLRRLTLYLMPKE